ncbi:uncharacterized protein TNCV_3010551 [Trichonephila clavipes]|nr:uncharacterized protein TNCV_3010551 [Trichonephila clavipes]
MAPHTITPAVGAVCRCKAKAGLRRSPRGLHTRTQLSSQLRLNLDLFHSALHSSFLLQNTTSPNRGASGWASRAAHVKGTAIPRRLRMVREDTGTPSEGATCAWMAEDEAVGCTRAFLLMLWS